MSTGSRTPAEALDLRESVSLVEASSTPTITKPDGTVIELGYDGDGNLREGGVFDARGRVPLRIIRPGIGKGRGRHLYPAEMLEEAAGTFTGWKMYLNHLSPEAKKKAGGLPRDIRDSGGRVQESWWDPTVPADPANEHDQGAVMGMVRPVKFIRNLIDDDPALAEASISASATGVQPDKRNGQDVWLVEGINPRGSVDWVTEAGAGGRIVNLLEESYADEEDMQMALLESMSDEEIRNHLQEARPELLEEGAPKKPEADDGDGKLAAKTEELKRKGMPEAVAREAAKKALSESTESDPEGGEVAEITPEALSEAVSADNDGKIGKVLVEAVQQNGDFQLFLSSLVESKLEEERGTIRDEARADVDRAFELARLERTAHNVISESKLPESWQADLKERFSLTEANAPTPELDVTAEVDDNGKTVKTAEAKLREAVEQAITKEQTRLREASTTRVRSAAPAAAPTKLEEGKDGEEQEPGGEATPQEKPYWETVLAEAGIEDPAKAYALEG